MLLPQSHCLGLTAPASSPQLTVPVSQSQPQCPQSHCHSLSAPALTCPSITATASLLQPYSPASLLQPHSHALCTSLSPALPPKPYCPSLNAITFSLLLQAHQVIHTVKIKNYYLIPKLKLNDKTGSPNSFHILILISGHVHVRVTLD